MILKKRFILGLVFLAIILVFHILLNGKFLNLQWIEQQREFLLRLVETRYIFSVFLFILVFIFATVLAIPVTVLFTVAAGYFFGVWTGLLYANIGATVGATVSFLLFRYLLGDFVQSRYSAKLSAFNREIQNYGYSYLLIMQLLPFSPTLLINIFAGMSKIRLWTFVWTTSLGILPGSLIYTLSGQHLAQIKSLRGLLSVRSALLLLVLTVFASLPIIVRSFSRGRRQ